MRPFIVSLAVDPSVLTSRERQALVAIAQGRTNREIAGTLGISVKTVDTHRGHVLKKLGLRNNSDLTRYAIRHAMVDVDGGEIGAADPVDPREVPVMPIAQPRSAIAQVAKSA